VLNTYLADAASIQVPSGFTTENLPVRITFFGCPYSKPLLLKLVMPMSRRRTIACRHRRHRHWLQATGNRV
jgi:Asp-tRNA(Asn)/Glu-tRNA(Gln) amidotransferase A subunit family amidase